MIKHKPLKRGFCNRVVLNSRSQMQIENAVRSAVEGLKSDWCTCDKLEDTSNCGICPELKKWFPVFYDSQEAAE